jgi:hypothetical protein
MSSSSFVVAIAQAKSEPWETIWHKGQVPTWIDRYKDEFNIVNVSGIPMGNLWKFFDAFHEKKRYSEKCGKWQGRLDYLFVPWLRRNLPTWEKLPSSQIDEIQIRTNSSYIFAGRRLLGTINWFFRETNYDFLFLTTTSSLINLRLLEKQISEFAPSQPIYAGHILGKVPNEFVSGAGQLLNRKTAELVLQNYRKFPHQMLNDAALGLHLRNHGVQPLEIQWCWVDSKKQVEDLRLIDLKQTMHYRVKTSTVPRQDEKVMKLLHEKLMKLSSKGKIDY